MTYKLLQVYFEICILEEIIPMLLFVKFISSVVEYVIKKPTCGLRSACGFFY